MAPDRTCLSCEDAERPIDIITFEGRLRISRPTECDDCLKSPRLKHYRRKVSK